MYVNGIQAYTYRSHLHNRGTVYNAEDGSSNLLIANSTVKYCNYIGIFVANQNSQQETLTKSVNESM